MSNAFSPVLEQMAFTCDGGLFMSATIAKTNQYVIKIARTPYVKKFKHGFTHPHLL